MALSINRLLYQPDEIVFINQSYMSSFSDFDADCTALSLTNPLTEGQWIYYTPAHGVETISENGTNSLPDNTVHSGMVTIIDNVSDFVTRLVARRAAALTAATPTRPPIGTTATPATGTITGTSYGSGAYTYSLQLTLTGVHVPITDAGGS